MNSDLDFDTLFGNRRESPARPIRPGGVSPTAVRLAILALLAVILTLGSANVYTEGLWFRSMGAEAVFRTRILAPVLVFAACWLVGGLFIGGNWLIAAWRATNAAAWPGQEGTLVGSREGRRLVWLISLVVAGVVAAGAMSAWREVLLFLHRTPFGVSEPILGRDVGFYVFELPVWHLLHELVTVWLGAAFIGSAAVYVVGGALNLSVAMGRRVKRAVTRGGAGNGAAGGRERGDSAAAVRVARTHLVIMAALGLLSVAAGQWLARFDLLYAARSSHTFYGPGVVDATLRLPAMGILAGLAVLAAVMLVATLGGRSWGWPLGIVVVYFATRAVLLGVVPALVQEYRVRPNELDREQTYIANNIRLTRSAYGLDGVVQEEYRLTGTLGAAVTGRAPAPGGGTDSSPSGTYPRATADNIRLWDWRVLQTTYNQIQSLRPYYQFRDVDVDRYDLASGERQVALAARELVADRLPNPTWVNRHLEFTHGHGLVVSPVDEVDPRSLPVLWASDIPVAARAPLTITVTQPRIYFGEAAGDDYVVVRSRTQEFDYPQGNANVRNNYDGADGVAIGSLPQKLLFALRFGDPNLLLSDALTAESRILLHRNIVDRVTALAPFLILDGDPYLVVTPEGRLVWLLDGYTASDRYPYAPPLGAGDDMTARFAGENYVRNSVKIAVDAYDGAVRFYVVDAAEPLIKAWRQIFPTLFADASEMPPGLVAHWRYPEALFRAQTSVFARYHVTDPGVFYNGEDRWTTPTESYRQSGDTLPMQPYYVTIKLRGETEPEFLLMIPFTPEGKPNMVAWLAARSSAARYGQLVAYSFGKGELVYGPQQIESRIESDPDISAQLSLWSQSGSQVIRGNLLVVPVDGTILYVEPLYLQAESNALPELRRVIVADSERVVMRVGIDEALTALVQGASTTGASATAGAGTTGGATGPCAGKAPRRRAAGQALRQAAMVRLTGNPARAPPARLR